MQHTATLRGSLSVSYWSYHESAKQTMVLIHGFTGSHEGFQYLEPLLPDIHLIIPDLPGFGISDLPNQSNWSIDGIAALTNQLVASLNLTEPPILLGHSMGELVASSMIHQQPTLYASQVILISPIPTAIHGVTDKRQVGRRLGDAQYTIGAKAGKIGDSFVRSKLISRILTFGLLKTADRDQRHAIYQHHLRNLDFISNIEFYKILFRDFNKRGAIDYADALRQKRVLLVAGNQDSVTPLTHIKNLSQAISPERFLVISNVGHLIHYEKAPQAAMAIKSFLTLD